MDNIKQTAGVKTLLGNPKKAIIKLSIPMIIAMSSQTLYNLGDAIWVSGIGPKALAAVGFTFPLFFLAMAIGSGLGIGGGSAISRKIGSRNKKAADNTAEHTVGLMVIISILFTILISLFAKPILEFMGAGSALDISVTYLKIIFYGIIFVFFTQTSVSILRSEGDAKRAMYAMVGGSILNLILDPIFIYYFNMGVKGAAVATVISMFLVSSLTFYWLFIVKNTYISFNFRYFKFNTDILYDISKVGLPASISQTSMSIMAFVITMIVAHIAGPNGVAIYTTSWRIIGLATLPVLGVASAITSVAGAAFGAKEYEKIKKSYFFAVKFGFIVEIFLAIIIFSFATKISLLFTWSHKSQGIMNEIKQALSILWIFIPTVPIGMVSSGMFQGVGKGIDSLIMTFIRTLLFSVPFAYFFGIYLGLDLKGVWIGIVVAGFAYLPVAFGWSYFYLRKLLRNDIKTLSNELQTTEFWQDNA